MSYLEVVWTDEVTGRKGFLVIDRLRQGASSGGLRMRDGCTLDEVRDLARGMTLKEAVVRVPGDRYQPFGGGKGGIDCSPHDPEARGVLHRYLIAMRPLLETVWSTGEDLGVRQDVLDELAGEIGLRSTIDAALRLLPDPEEGLGRVKAGFAVDVDGISLADLVGGYGVAVCALAALRGRAGVRAVIQGFGSMGGATARYLARSGVAVVGIADDLGLVVNPAGLDVERLLAARDSFGRIDRSSLRASDTVSDGHWLDVDCELLVPAAISYAITEPDAGRVRARLVVEAANCATTPEAEAALAARGVTVLPDFVANVATNAWWWWTLFGDIEPTEAAAFAKIAAVLGGLTDAVLQRSAAAGGTPRAAALEIASALG
ncbi:Glu/Leu/Phe/Val dehydrogenase dimerization domain-containing protein [Hamadaea tsunoensis]|uniref:Glu/Leu/Phe/Val dehydrogenase dimerization domain-containing protein n=1 Tax=Hamadaea tsunoensis TaxID=53368 RepID=UPI000418E5F5|nr:Glu/Leu/Phe/Val dehydrogenase dimerization domain-containing protein [Hamadaea tsunoensis]